MKIMFLVPSGIQCSQAQFRVLPYVDIGRRMGLDISWQAVPKSPYGRYSFFSRLPRVDTFVVHREQFSALELNALRRLCTTLVYDIGDAAWTLPDSELCRIRGRRRAAKAARRFERICRAADMCIVDNRALADVVAAYQEHVRIVPTPVDCTICTPGTGGNEGGTLLVGWMGPASGMEMVRGILGLLTPRVGPMQFSIVSDVQYDGPGSEYVFWSNRSQGKEVQQIQAMDVGLVPLPGDAYWRAGNGIDILRYMACGVPVVASNVGANADIIDHGIDGFLVRDESDWTRHVMRLVEDVSLREQMIDAARKKASDKYSLDVMSPMLWSALGL